MRNLFDPPSTRAKNKRVAIPALKHHLFVELTHTHRLTPARSREEDSVEPAVRDCAAIQNRNLFDALPRREPVAIAIPRNPRS